MNPPAFYRVLLVPLACVLWPSVPGAFAADLYWDGTSTDFTAVTAWSTVNNATTPNPAAIPGVSDVAVFRATTAGGDQTVNLNSDHSILGIRTESSTATTTIQGGGSNRIMTLGAGVNGINHTAGRLIIGSTSDGSRVDLRLQGSTTFTSAATGTNAAGMVIYGTISPIVAGASTLTLTGINSVPTIHGVISDGAGTLSIDKTRNTGTAITGWTLSGANTYSGTTTVSIGTLTADHNNALGSTVGGTSVANGATLSVGNGRTITGETITLLGQGESNLGALTNVIGGTSEWAGIVNLNNATARIGAGENGSMLISGVIQGQILNISGNGASGSSGIVTVSAANTYTGATNIIRGTLRLGANNTLPAGTVVDIHSIAGAAENATLDLNNFNQTIGGLQNSGGTNVTVRVMNSGASMRTLTIDTAVARSYTGIISGNMGITKTGVGTQTLSGVNTYTGVTRVNAGSLALGAAGSIANSSEVALGGGTFNVSAKVAGLTLGAGQKLSGSGTVTGDLIINGNLAIGNSPGTVTFNDDLTLGSSSISDFEFTNGAFTPGTFDLALGTGDTVTFGGTLNLLFSGSYTNNSTVNIFQSFGTYTGTFSTVNFSGLAGGQSATFDALTGIVTVVPEPTTALLIGCGLFALVLRRRRSALNT